MNDFFEIYRTSVRKVQGRAHASAVGPPPAANHLNPKIDQKFDQNFDQFSLSILDRFGVVLGRQLGVIFGQISSPNRLGIVLTSKTLIFTK